VNEQQSTNEPEHDPGLVALVMMLRFQGFGVDPEQIRHQFRGAPVGVSEMLRFAKMLGLKAKATRTDWNRLGRPARPIPWR
jgi:subfamily B ATP-binding cassette protein HlyB/CyaB